MQTDPIGYADQMNLYAYVNNDPVNAIDPTGTQALDQSARFRSGLELAGGDVNVLTEQMARGQLIGVGLASAGAVTLAAAPAASAFVLSRAPELTAATEFAAGFVPGAEGAALAGAGFGGVRALSQTLQDAGVSRAGRLEVINSFTEGTIQARTSSGGENVIRFFGGEAGEFGRFVTPSFPVTGTARSTFALPPSNTASSLTQFNLREGTTVFEGAVAPNFGYSGGGSQIFVPNLDDLVKP